jgi:hypothetical protein
MALPISENQRFLNLRLRKEAVARVRFPVGAFILISGALLKKYAKKLFFGDKNGEDDFQLGNRTIFLMR